MLMAHPCMKSIAILLSILIPSTPLSSSAQGPWSAPNTEEKKKDKEQEPALEGIAAEECAASMLRGKQDAGANHSSTGWKA